MKNRSWVIVEVAAGLLDQSEREAVLGDLSEACEGPWRALIGVLGLALRRQLLYLLHWRPWLASFGLALPGSLLLMGISVWVGLACMRFVDLTMSGYSPQLIQDSFFQLLSACLILMVGSWTCGFVMGSISPRTLWAGMVLSSAACSFCFARFREPSLSKFCLFLFLPPAILGIRHALRSVRMNAALAILMACSITSILIYRSMGQHQWQLNWALALPAWYIVVMSVSGRKRRGKSGYQEHAGEIEA